jgi:hypothetical protein
MEFGVARAQNHECAGRALVGEGGGDVGSGERLLGRVLKVAKRQRGSPVAHRRGDREAEQNADGQKHQQHKLRADPQPPEQWPLRASRGVKRGIQRGAPRIADAETRRDCGVQRRTRRRRLNVVAVQAGLDSAASGVAPRHTSTNSRLNPFRANT